eukprot:CAMPEP_0196719562 /NCGR_PEP_ID=MMETSP1091-20130531/2513_1 /TAXON_ID=302021 /ORGANISM="Rhodomonas sp., Strain CCMP768" /LENGTH=325 /DNA_ID=CAMNT_0042060541 /DNA_START=23 /DNA_END=1000 /DNA_ORIENTATION=+
MRSCSACFFVLGLATLLCFVNSEILGNKLAFATSAVPALRRFETNRCVLQEPGSAFALGTSLVLAPTENSARVQRASNGASSLFMGRAAAVRANKKGKTDAAKAKLYSRYGKMVTMAVKAGGTDPVANVQLGKILEQAKSAGVPKANLENVLKKANSKDTADYKELQMEVYAHGGVGFVIDILTDNNNRAAGDIRTVVNKKNLKLAEPGSVAFNFDRVGLVQVQTDADEDTMTEAAVDAGADDLEQMPADEDGKSNGYNVFTEKADLMAVADGLKEAGYTVTEAAFIWKPKAPMEISEADEELNLEALDMLEELDDVDAVFTNMA